MTKVMIVLIVVLILLIIAVALFFKKLMANLKYEKELEKKNEQLEKRLDIVQSVDKKLEELEKNAKKKKSELTAGSNTDIANASSEFLQERTKR